VIRRGPSLVAPSARIKINPPQSQDVTLVLRSSSPRPGAVRHAPTNPALRRGGDGTGDDDGTDDRNEVMAE